MGWGRFLNSPTHGCLNPLLALAVAVSIAGCATAEPTVALTKLRSDPARVRESSRGEQPRVLAEQGMPDVIWQRQLAVEVWAYCDVPEQPRFVEFGYDGRILAEWRGRNTDYCSDELEILVEE